MNNKKPKTPSEQLQDELEPILQWEDEGGFHPPVEESNEEKEKEDANVH